jgi:hypothetical protein
VQDTLNYLAGHMRDAPEANQEAWIRAMFYPARLSAQQVSSFRLGDIGSRPRIPLDLVIYYLEFALDARTISPSSLRTTAQILHT